MVVDNVLDHGDAAAVAFPHEVLVLIAATCARFDHEQVRVAISPTDAGELGHRQQFDRVDAEITQVIQ